MPTRRNLLKSIGMVAGGVPAVDLAHSALASDTFEVGIFLSRETFELYEETFGDGDALNDRIRRWIEGVFSHPENPYSVVVRFGDPVDTPTERIFEGDALREVTSEDGEQTWDSIHGWWKEYQQKGNTEFVAEDSNILVTLGGGGVGAPGGRRAVAGNGDLFMSLPHEYQPFGYSYAYESIEGVAHELGHNLLSVNTHYALTAAQNQDELPPLDTQYEGLRELSHEMGHHDLGTVVEDPDRPGTYSTTLMRYGPGESNCSCSDHADRNNHGYANFFSRCTIEHISK